MTPKYVVSHYCNRELALADLLRKPIIPVMYDKVPWPPPGGMSLMFSQLVYINMKGTSPLTNTPVWSEIWDVGFVYGSQISQFCLVGVKSV